MNKLTINEQYIQRKIFKLRNQQVMLDKDLADLYEVKTIRLREQVKRNKKRFPNDFMFQLTNEEVEFMVSQNAIPSKQYLGGHLPLVFTEQGIFFDGQIFDAYIFVSNLIKSSKKSIILIDNYIDETVLTLFSKNQEITVTIFTKNISRQLKLDIKKYNEQYKPIIIKSFSSSHDRFLIIDDKKIYHFGASLKDLGKKWFAFSKFDIEAIEILNKLKNK